MRTSGKQSALHFLTMQRVQDIFEVHSCSALHWRAKGSSCNVANGSIASTSYSRTILGSDRLGHFEGVFTGTNRRPSWLLIEVDWECVLTWHFVVLGWCRPWGSEWMRISDPWRKSIGACWHEWLWAKHDWGWSRHICRTPQLEEQKDGSRTGPDIVQQTWKSTNPFLLSICDLYSQASLGLSPLGTCWKDVWAMKKTLVV